MRILIETLEDTIEGDADPCQDFDGRFLVISDGERYWINGWMVRISFPDFPGFTLDQVIAGLTVPACGVL